MSYMTKLDGVPDTDNAKPGMAFFEGTGPVDKTCGDCKHRGLTRQSKKAKWSDKLNQLIYKSYRTTQCSMYKKLSGTHGAAVKKYYLACKYFEQKVK